MRRTPATAAAAPGGRQAHASGTRPRSRGSASADHQAWPTALTQSEAGLYALATRLASERVLLDQDRRECVVYDRRPAACRFYLVASDPLWCSSMNRLDGVQIVNTAQLEGVVMRHCIELSQGSLGSAPIALLLLFSLPVVAQNQHDRRLLESLTLGLPAPTDWARKFEQEGVRWSSEKPAELRRAPLRAFAAAFGLATPE